MSRVCEICGKGPTIGMTKSHSNIKNKRWVQINLQNKKINGQRKKICTRCIKNLSKKS